MSCVVRSYPRHPVGIGFGHPTIGALATAALSLAVALPTPASAAPSAPPPSEGAFGPTRARPPEDAAPPVESAAPTPTDEWGPEDDVSTPTAAAGPAPVAAPAPAIAAPAAAAPDSPEVQALKRELGDAKGLVVGGWVVGGIGVGSLVVITGGALLLGAIADSRADDAALEDTERLILAEEEELRDRADRRFRFALISGVVGASIAAAGGVMLGVGIPRRNRIQDKLAEASARPRAGTPTARIAPWGDRNGGGVSLVGRF